MIVSIHQPSYFPWLGLLHKIRMSDTYVVMDEVQLADRAYQHRNQFLDAQGESRLLSIPFVREGWRDKPLRELAIADDSWRKRHFEFIRLNYGKHPFAGEVLGELEAYYSAVHATLFDAVFASMKLALALFAVPTRVVRQSELAYDRSQRKAGLIVSLARAAGATTYLSGTGAREYLSGDDFAAGPELRWTAFQHPTYPQRHARDFVPGLACLDLVFNVGRERAAQILATECGT